MTLQLTTALIAIIVVLAVATALAARAIERRHPPSGEFVPVIGGRLHVLDLATTAHGGAGLPVVLLHGASANLEDMRLALGDRLAQRHRVILFDRPGHGFSDRGGGQGGEPARQAGLIVEALARIGVARAIFVGHSWSGALVTALALAHPERVAGLVLLAAVTHPWQGGISWYYNVATTPMVGEFFARTVVIPVGALLLRPGSREVFAPQPRPDRYLRRAAIALHLRRAHFLANARDVAGLKTFLATQVARYREITAPTVIIAGDSDRTVSARIHSQALARLLPHAKLIVLPGIGHMPHHVAPDTIVAEIDRLAAEVAGRESAMAG